MGRQPGRELSRSEAIIAFCERYLRIPEGSQVGRPVRLREWQKDIIRRIYDTPTRQVIISLGRKNGKGLALDTPIPTPSGWRMMGELQPGDQVFGADGRPTRVSFVSETHTGLRCWKITFSDGSSVIADEQHRWLTKHRFRPWAKARVNGSGNGGRWTVGVVTTPQIAQSVRITRPDGGFETNHKIGCAPALLSDPTDLPIDPYVLGAWLGDGTTAGATLTCSERDLDEMVGHLNAGLSTEVSVARYSGKAPTIKTGGSGLQVRLRALGVLGDKHIPPSYLNAGTDQRWALLQGLMDTDGTVTRASGKTTHRCSFTATKYRLAHDTWRLARSLGLKATIRESVAKLDGRAVGPKFDVAFTASRGEPIFSLERKQSLLPQEIGQRSRTLTIVSCDEVESVPTRCIQVEAADSLFLCGHGCVPTHNTALVAMIVLAHLVGPEARRNAQIYSAAQSRDQAGIVFGLASKMVRMNPTLNAPDKVVVRESAKELFSPLTGVRYKALSADATTAYGFSPVLVIHDELGQVRGERSALFDALETAMGAQVEPLSIVISTQAPTSLDLLSKLIDDAQTKIDPRQKLILFAAGDGDDIEDEATWRKANPALGDFLNVEEIRGLAAKAARMPSFEASFRNLHLNQRVSALNQLFSPSIWEANGGPVDFSVFEDAPVYAGLDLSGSQDMTALVLVTNQDGLWHVWPHFWTPEATMRDRMARDRAPYDVWVAQDHLIAVPGVTIDYGFVAHRLAELASRCDLRVVRYDRWRIKDLSAALSAIGADIPLEECGQGYRDMAPAIEALETVMLQKKVRHGMHPVLTWNAANAVITPDAAGNRKFDKSVPTGRIDGMVALAMAFGAATASTSTSLDIEAMVA